MSVAQVGAPAGPSIHAASAQPATVLFVSHTGVWGGGAEVVLLQLMTAARKAGFRAALAAPPGELIQRAAPSADAIYEIDLPGLRRTSNPGRATRMAGAWMRGATQLAGVIRRSHADIAHANSGVAALICCPAATVTRRPLVWHQHDIVPPRAVNRLALQPCGLLASRVIACSHAVVHSLQAVGVPTRRTAVMYNCARPEFFHPLPNRTEARDSLGLPKDRFVVAMAGRLVPYKGHMTFLDSLGQLTSSGIDIHGAIAGSVPDPGPGHADPFPGYLARLEARARRPDLQGRVSFLGHQDDVRSVMAAADVLAVPSAGEPFPLIVIEALAAEVPVVASDSGGHPEAIQDGENGLLFKTGDTGELASALRSLADDPELGRRLSDAGRKRAVAEFSEDDLPERLLAVYSDLGVTPAPAGHHGRTA